MNKKLYLLSFLPFLACCSGGGTESTKEEKSMSIDVSVEEHKEFDEENIIFKAPLISDEHIGYVDQNIDNKERFDYALKTLKELNPNGFDAVLACGDQTQNGLKSEVTDLVNIYKNNFSLDETPFVFAHGNHDTYWSGCMTTTEFYDAYGSDVYKYDLDQTAAKLGNRHVKINGIDIVALQIKTFMPSYNDFTDQTMDWFDRVMQDISNSNPGMPVIVLCHSPAYNTIYGSCSNDDCGDWGASKQLNVMLKDYPNAILFSGHTHYGITDERTIMQTDFTSIGAGSICDIDLDTNFENVKELDNRRSYSFASIIEIDNKGNTRVTRYDLIKKDTIKSSWIIESPKEDKSHLQKYNYDYRVEHNVDPKFPQNGELKVTQNSQGQINLEFDAFEDDDMIFYYELRIFLEPQEEITNLDDYVLNYKMMVSWYDNPNPQTGKILLDVPTKFNTAYSYALIAYDSFGGFDVVYPTTK